MELTGIGFENVEAFLPLMPSGTVNVTDYRVAIGAIEDDKAVGVALYNDLGDALMLDYIYVDPEYRRRGIGTALIEDFLKEIQGTGAVALHTNYPEKSAELHQFFEAKKFRLFRDGISWRIPVEALLNSKSLEKLLKTPSKNKVLTLGSLNRHEQQILRKAMAKEKLDPSIVGDSSLFDPLSLVTINLEKDAPMACIFSQKSRSEISVLYLVNFTKDPMQLVDLFRAFKDVVEKESYEDNDLLLVTMDAGMEKFVKSIVGSEDKLINEGNVVSGIRMLV